MPVMLTDLLRRHKVSLLVVAGWCLLPVVAGAAPSGAVSDPASPLPPMTAPAYVLRAGDDLDISFFYNPEMNQHAPVRPDGRISMPLLGEVQAEGFTVQRFTEVLEGAYRLELKKASLNVQVRSLPNQVVYIGGEVERPGVFALRGAALNALQAVIEAGGLKESAAHGGITVLRRGSAGNVEIHDISLRAKKGEVAESARFQLQPLDVLIVRESRISKVDRVMDQYVKKLTPVLLTGGFTYLFGNPATVVP